MEPGGTTFQFEKQAKLQKWGEGIWFRQRFELNLYYTSDLTKMRLTFSPHYLPLSNTETHSDRLKGMKWLTGEKNNEKLTPKSTRWRDRANSTALISPPLNNKHIWSIFVLPVPVSTFSRGGAYTRFCFKIKKSATPHNGFNTCDRSTVSICPSLARIPSTELLRNVDFHHSEH